jgi:hypothetical protein
MPVSSRMLILRNGGDVDTFLSALRRFRQAGIRIAQNHEAGAAAYISVRTEWDSYIAALAPFLAYSMSEIDPAGSNKVGIQAHSCM